MGSWTQKGSCSDFRIGGTIFLNREMLRNPWWVAEHLLHESLHQKLYDFRHTHSLLTKDLAPPASSREPAAKVNSIWNVGGATGSNQWDTFRTVAAFHVYVHQAALCLQAERRMAVLGKAFGAPNGSFPAMTTRPDALMRAHYLGAQLRKVCWHELGPAGRLLVEWLVAILGALDPAPPPTESAYLHLLFHRYMTEAAMVAAKKLPPEGTTLLLKLVEDEAEILRRVLSTIKGKVPERDRLAEARLARQGEGAEAAFLRFRSLAVAVLQRCSPDGYGVSRPPSADSRALDRMIQSMMDRSNQQLVAYLGSPA
jgi:hypothetical protein